MRDIRFSARASRIRALAGLCFGLCAAASATTAQASCGNRPGTPRNVQAFAESATKIKVQWTNTTGRFGAATGIEWGEFPTIYFDMYLRDGAKKPIGRDLTGVDIKQNAFSYNSVTWYYFDKLSPNTNYCFALRTRTEAGTQGCVSAQTSNWACTTTKAR